MATSNYIHKSHNVSVLIYHIVCPSKYRRIVFDENVDKTLKEICLEISYRYQIYFLEIGTDLNHVHFLIQSVPTYSITKIVTIIKSFTAKEIFKKHPEVKKILWGGEFWSDGYVANTVSKFGTEKSISEYVKNQGKEKEYSKIYTSKQLTLW